MLYERYQVKISPDFLTFEFVSKGPKGDIIKVVSYSEINIKGFYNLGFGDKNPITGNVDDMIITNNNDSQKILATVASTLYAFTNNYPNAVVLASGSTEARTRLYRIGISNNLITIEKDFIVLGLTKEDWEPFRRNISYIAFLVRRKM